MLLQWNCPSSISPFPIFFFWFEIYFRHSKPPSKRRTKIHCGFICAQYFFRNIVQQCPRPSSLNHVIFFFLSTFTRFLSNSITWGRHLEKCVRAHLPRPKFADWLMGGALLLIGTISLFVLVSFWFLWCCFCAVCERFRGGAVKQISSDWRPEH